MKLTRLATTIALAALINTNSQAGIVSYNESGNDAVGDSFSITFQWDNVNDTVTGATAGSFIYGATSFNASGITDLIPPIQSLPPGAIEATFGNNPVAPSYYIDIALNAGAIPTPSSAPGFYAAEVVVNGVTVDFNTKPEIVAVPEPTSLAVLSAGLLGWAAASKKHKKLG